MLNIFTDDWIDTNKLHLLNPQSFAIPTNSELDNLSIGDLVKIGNKLERFWVKIIQINKDYLLGKIDNLLTFNENYNYNDIVLFEINNIYEIYSEIITNVIDVHLKSKCPFKKKK